MSKQVHSDDQGEQATIKKEANANTSGEQVGHMMTPEEKAAAKKASDSEHQT